MKPIKHFKYHKKKQVTLKSLMPRFILFAIFIFASSLCLAADSILGVSAGLLLATGAAGASTNTIDNVMTAFKESLKGFDLKNPETANAVKNFYKESGLLENQENGLGEISGKLGQLIDEMKTANQNRNKIPEGGIKKLWCHSLLTDHENTSEDEKELNRLGFNRYVKNLFLMHTGKASAEVIQTMQQLNIEIKQRHGLQTTNVDAEGGFTIPLPMLDLILDDLRQSGLFMSELTTLRLTRRHVVAPVLAAAGHPAPSIKLESTTAAAQRYAVGNIVFGTHEFRVKDNGVIIPWTSEMEFDSIVDMGALISQYVAEWFNIYGDDILFKGNAQAGNNKIYGLYELLASMQTVETSGNTFSTIHLDDFITADGNMRSVDKRNMKRYMSPSVHATIKKIKTVNQNYLLDSTERLAGTIEGKPVIESDSCYAMSESGANKAMVINGNLQKGYLALLNGMGISVEKTNVASWVDGEITRHAFQENLIAIRVNLPFDIQHPFPNRYVAIKTKA